MSYFELSVYGMMAFLAAVVILIILQELGYM